MPSKKAQALLAYLASPIGLSHRREKLASILWSDRPEESARQNLRQCLTTIRKMSGGGEGLPIFAEGDCLRLDRKNVAVDVAEFEQALRSRDPNDLMRAFTLYRGEFLEGLNLQAELIEEWLVAERRRLRTIAIEGLVQLLEHQQRSGAYEEAMQTALRLLSIDPLQEEVHRSLMRLYDESGNTAQALRQYIICEETLRRELAVEPESATKELRREILRSRQVSPLSRSENSVELNPHLPRGSEILEEVDAPVVPRDRPSVAVLPFQSYGDDFQHACLADILCEDITTALSSLSRLMVIACSTSICYKGKKIDARTVGQELGVAHVVEGSVRIIGSRVRVSAQLIDTSSGAHVWADRYDRAAGDAFGVQDEITQEIVTALEVKLTHGEQIRTWRREAISLDAYRHFVRGRDAYLTSSRSAMGRAREELQRAISITARFATAHVILGFTYADEARFQWRNDRAEALSNARALARKALAIDAECGAAHSLLGYVAMLEYRFEIAIDEGGRAVAMRPSDADAYHVLAMTRIYNGDFIDGLRLERRSLRLSPLALENSLLMLGRAYFHLRQFEDAITVMHRVSRAKPDWLSAQTLLAACYAESGDFKRATHAAAQILKMKPNFSTTRWAGLHPYRRADDLERYISCLLRIGLPRESPPSDNRA